MSGQNQFNAMESCTLPLHDVPPDVQGNPYQHPNQSKIYLQHVSTNQNISAHVRCQTFNPGEIPNGGLVPSHQPGNFIAQDVDIENGDTVQLIEFAFSNKSIRNAFLRKVYGILAIQLMITFGIMAIMFFPPQVKEWVMLNTWFMISAGILGIILTIFLMCVPNLRRKTPWNMILLMLYTVCQGCMMGTVCAFADSEDVLKAVVTTIVLLVALTLFAFQNKIDFTLCSGSLLILILGFLIFGVLASIFRDDILVNFFAAIGSVIFGLYIVVDLEMMIGGNHNLNISPEEYVFAALNLYLDIINLMLHLIELFGKK